MNSPDGDPNCAVMHFANTKEDKIKEMIRAYKVFMDLPDADETLFRQINNLLIEAREDELRKLVLAKNHFFTITVSDKTFIELTSKHIDDRLAQLKAQKGDS